MSCFKPLSILITDDVEQNRVYLSQLFQSILKNAQIQEAENGKVAIDLVAEKLEATGGSFDLILMDFKMPVLNGADTTLAIRQLEKTANLAKPSIIITWSSAKDAPYPEADDWIPKMPKRMELERMLITYGLI
jgi:CheY-like chemotaxis protein